MHDIFVSYVEEDDPSACQIVDGLEAAGHTAWHYQRDSRPGLSYLLQTGRAIEEARAIVLLISPHSTKSNQVTVEVVRAFECNKPFVPLLLGLTHGEFQRLQPEWRQALGASVTIPIRDDGVATVLPRVLEALQRLGISPTGRPPDREQDPQRGRSSF